MSESIVGVILFVIFTIQKIECNCPTVCRCYSSIVNCHNKNLNNTDFMKDVPKTTTALYIDNNNISELHPDLFKDFKDLKILDIDNNNIEQLHPNIFNTLEKLTFLDLHGNKFISLDPDIFKGLMNLQKLYLYSNKLKSLDPNLFKGLKNLQILYFHINEITTLHPELFNELTNLRNLDFERNYIEQLHPNIFNKLKKLEFLDLHGNKFKSLDPDIFKELKNLNTLNIFQYVNGRDNNIIFNFVQTKIDNNKITTLHPELFIKLTNLRDLDMGNNNIKQLHPNIFNRLKKLEILDLHSNNLKSLDPDIFKGLKYLQTLYLYKNDIEHLSPTIFNDLTNLKILYIKMYEIGKLPTNIFNSLKNLETLFIGVEEIDVDIFKQLTKLKLVKFVQTNMCSCQVLYVIHHLQTSRNTSRVYYRCVSPTTIDIGSKRFQHENYNWIQNYCASAEWSSWNNQTQCSGNWNGYNMHTRRCVQMFSNSSCFGMSRKLYPCGNMKYLSGKNLKGNVQVKDITQNRVKLAPPQLKELKSNNSVGYNALKTVLAQTIELLLSYKNIQTENLDLNINFGIDAKHSVFYTYQVSNLTIIFTNLEDNKLLWRDTEFEITKDGVIFGFTLSPGTHINTAGSSFTNNEWNGPFGISLIVLAAVFFLFIIVVVVCAKHKNKGKNLPESDSQVLKHPINQTYNVSSIETSRDYIPIEGENVSKDSTSPKTMPSEYASLRFGKRGRDGQYPTEYADLQTESRNQLSSVYSINGPTSITIQHTASTRYETASPIQYEIPPNADNSFYDNYLEIID